MGRGRSYSGDGSRSQSRSRSGRGAGGGSRRPRGRRSRSRSRRRSRSRGAGGDGALDQRPAIEREKGGVKLFVGRLPREVSQRKLKECFEEFGEVFEIFVIDSKALSNVGCAFVRMARIADAEKAIEELHEQRVLIPSQRELGPMQVAFAKGEAVRLGLDEREEVLPSFKEARKKVQEHQEKRRFFEELQKRQARQHEAMEQARTFHQEVARQISRMSSKELGSVVKEGERAGGKPFKDRWSSHCDLNPMGCRDRNPSHHPTDSLEQFLLMAALEYGRESWFRKRFKDLPRMPAPDLLPPPPPMLPGAPPLAVPCGMPPGAPPGVPPCMPPVMPPVMPPGMMIPPIPPYLMGPPSGVIGAPPAPGPTGIPRSPPVVHANAQRPPPPFGLLPPGPPPGVLAPPPENAPWGFEDRLRSERETASDDEAAKGKDAGGESCAKTKESVVKVENDASSCAAEERKRRSDDVTTASQGAQQNADGASVSGAGEVADRGVEATDSHAPRVQAMEASPPVNTHNQLGGSTTAVASAKAERGRGRLTYESRDAQPLPPQVRRGSGAGAAKSPQPPLVVPRQLLDYNDLD